MIPSVEPDPALSRTGVVIRDPLPWHQVTQVVATAEDTGYDAVFVPEIAGREAFSTLAGFALSTHRIGLGTGVVTVRSRTPFALGMAAATLQELSTGRLVLGLGAGPGGPGALDMVRGCVRILRSLFRGEAVSADEGIGTPSSFRLELADVAGVAPVPPPSIWLAALGDRMVALSGEIADGVLLNWCTPERVAAARATASERAAAAGRDPARITVAVYVRACLGVDEDVALLALKEMTGRYASLPHYHRQFEAMGLGEEAALAAKAFDGGRIHDVPDGLVRTLTVAGGRAEALARFREFHEAGADLVLCYPVAALDPFSSILGTVLGAAPHPALER